jgi:hypothetical protein
LIRASYLKSELSATRVSARALIEHVLVLCLTKVCKLCALFLSLYQNAYYRFRLKPLNLVESLSSLGFSILGLIGLVIIGLVIIFVIRLLFMLIPAALVALAVWFLTGSLWLAGVAFLVVAALSILKKL